MSYDTNFQIILTGINNTDAAFRALGANLDTANTKTTRLVETQKQAVFSAKDLAVGLSGLATAGFGLYMSFDRIEKSQVALDRANLMVKRSTESVDQATKTYNETVAKYGVSSVEAKDAADKLAIAQDALTVSHERADLAQNNLSNSMATFALSIVPTAITTIASLSNIMKAMNVTSAADLALKLAEVPAYIAATAASAAHAIAEGIETVATWLLVTATATQIGLLTLGAGLILAAIATSIFLANAHRQDAAATDSLNVATESLNESLDASAYAQAQVAAQAAKLAYQLKLATDAQKEYFANAKLAAVSGGQIQAGINKISDAMRENSDMTKTLTVDYQKMRVETDANLGAIKTSFDEAFNTGDIAKATQIVRTFADKYMISLDDALEAIERFKAKQEEIPKSIEEELVGRAQADLEAFQKCASGKFAQISAIGTDEMDALVSDVNDLLSQGLVGQAQDSIKAFQDCSTDKMADLATSIQASLDEMVQNGIDSAGEFEKYATLEKWLEIIKRQVAEAAAAANFVAALVSKAEEKTAIVEAKITNAALIHSLLGAGGANLGMTIPFLQSGGIVSRPTVALLGESGPEAIVPLSSGQVAPNITIYFNVEGSCDRKTADYAIAEMERSLKNVVVESTSANAASTHKRIRLGSRIE